MNLDENGYPREIPPTWWRAALIAILLLHIGAPGPDLIPRPWHWLGVGLLGLALGLLLWAGLLFKRAGTGIRPFSPSTKLVTHGPFRRTRNPMYLGLVLALAGTAVWCGETTPWLAVVAFAFVIDRRFIVREERFMAERFGDSYRDYCERVRRWL